MVKITSLDNTKEIFFGHDVYVLREKDLGSGGINLESYQGNNQIGTKITGRQLGERDITLSGYVLAQDADEMLLRKRYLQTLVSPFEDFYLYVNDYKIRVSAKETIKYAKEWYRNNQYLAQFLIQGTCANPCFTAAEESHSSTVLWERDLHFPLQTKIKNPHLPPETHQPLKKLHFGVQRITGTRVIDNTGETPVGLRIQFASELDYVTDPYIVNPVTKERLLLHCTIERGDRVIVNTNYGEKSVIKIKPTGETEDIFYKVDIDSSFIQLAVGKNYLESGAAENASGLIVDFYYSPQYLEVV